jgi:hypothetical protein
VESDSPKILFWEWVVKPEFAFPNSPLFLAKIDDFGLECCIPEENLKNKSSGKNQYYFFGWLSDQVIIPTIRYTTPHRLSCEVQEVALAFDLGPSLMAYLFHG